MNSKLKEGTVAAVKFIVPKVALIVLICLYALAGGYIFQHLESTNEQQECIERMNKYLPVENETLNNIWSIITSYRTPGDAESAINAFKTQLSTFRDSLLLISYDGTNCTMMGETNGSAFQWSLPGAILFSTTVFTTVGYGNIAPKTSWGRMVCIAYAILGIPLMLLALANIGEIMANIFRYTYLNICCCGILKWHPRSSSKGEIERWKTNYLEDQQKQRCGNNEITDDEEEDEDLDKISVPIVITLFLIGSYVFLGALLFSVWIQLSWMDAAYFSFITLSTIGFGDIVPGTSDLNSTSAQLQMMGTALYMVIGMAILSMAFNLMQEEVVDKIKWLGSCINTIKENREMKNK